MKLARARARTSVAIAVAAVALALPAAAQVPPPTMQRPAAPRFLEFRTAVPGPRYGQREAPEVPVSLQATLERGRALIEAGRLDQAKDTLQAALSRHPHHPAVVLELSSAHLARRAWRAVEQLARAERTAARDSLLLGQDLVVALRSLGKPREAALVVLEAWVASPFYMEWAAALMDTLAPADPKAAREAMRRAATANPMRPDLVRAAARLEWRAGDTASAMRLLDAADQAYKGAPMRWSFAEELLSQSSAADSSGAIEVLLDLAGDHDRDLSYRVVAARRAWETMGRRGGSAEGAPRVARAMQDVPVAKWGGTLGIEVVRGLRQGGATAEARRLLVALGDQSQAVPEVAIERALNDLRDGPPERALEALARLAESSDEAAFRYAEALFFSGQPDSALAWYKASDDPASPYTGAALERTFLIEDANPKSALGLFGRLAYEQWRGETRRALALADSLYRTLPHASLWAQAAITLAALREATGDGKSALEPLLALADGLPDDRLAPQARQKAGDVYRVWLRDDAKALAQYEECLARYPKSWNAPEVRRWVETMRRERRF